MNRRMHERIPEKKLGTSKIDKAPEMGRTKKKDFKMNDDLNFKI